MHNDNVTLKERISLALINILSSRFAVGPVGWVGEGKFSSKGRLIDSAATS